ncbi:MAG: aminodeoxychorismate/anthranilate synthase component I, partial [Gemmatimonadales bacterium]
MSAPAPHVERLGSIPDPADAAERFADLPLLLLLDSTADHERIGRYSFLAADPYRIVRTKGDGDSLAAVRAALAPFAAPPVPGLPPFQGGAAGFIGYDWGATLERLPEPRYDDLALPDVLLGLYDWVIAWDHCERAAWIISTGTPVEGESRARRARERLDMVRARLAGEGGSGRETESSDAGSFSR